MVTPNGNAATSRRRIWELVLFEMFPRSAVSTLEFTLESKTLEGKPMSKTLKTYEENGEFVIERINEFNHATEFSPQKKA